MDGVVELNESCIVLSSEVFGAWGGMRDWVGCLRGLGTLYTFLFLLLTIFQVATHWSSALTLLFPLVVSRKSPFIHKTNHDFLKRFPVAHVRILPERNINDVRLYHVQGVCHMELQRHVKPWKCQTSLQLRQVSCSHPAAITPSFVLFVRRTLLHTHADAHTRTQSSNASTSLTVT